MFESMHARLANIAEADNDREDRLGIGCPTRLDLWLVGGHELRDVCLVDGLNSLDDHTIDVRLRAGAPIDENFTVAIAHIVIVRHVWPSEADETAARSAERGGAIGAAIAVQRSLAGDVTAANLADGSAQ